MYGRLASLFVLGVTFAGCGAAASPPSPAPTSTAIPTTTAKPTASATPTATASPGATPSATPTTAPTSTQAPTPSPTPAGLRPPAGLRLTADSKDYSDGSFTLTNTVSWTNELSAGTTVKVFGINKCLATTDGAPCVIDGMNVPNKNLLLLGSAAGIDGHVSWSYWAPEGASYYCGAQGVVANKGQIAKEDQWYWAVVLRAEDGSGMSDFTVAATSNNEDLVC